MCHKNQKRHKCDHCGREFNRRDSFNEHVLIHISPRHKCPHCPKDQKQIEPYQCVKCGWKFSHLYPSPCSGQFRLGPTRPIECSQAGGSRVMGTLASHSQHRTVGTGEFFFHIATIHSGSGQDSLIKQEKSEEIRMKKGKVDERFKKV